MIIYTTSNAFQQYVKQVVGLTNVVFQADLSQSNDADAFCLIHASCYDREKVCHFIQSNDRDGQRVAVAENIPNVSQMLLYGEIGVKAYCNAYMAALYYQQLIELLRSGQSWFPPSLLKQAFELASQSINEVSNAPDLSGLTPREREVALCAVKGNSNKHIARELDIAETTVKAHLSKVFKKLDVKDRISLTFLFK